MLTVLMNPPRRRRKSRVRRSRKAARRYYRRSRSARRYASSRRRRGYTRAASKRAVSSYRKRLQTYLKRFVMSPKVHQRVDRLRRQYEMSAAKERDPLAFATVGAGALPASYSRVLNPRRRRRRRNSGGAGFNYRPSRSFNAGEGLVATKSSKTLDWSMMEYAGAGLGAYFVNTQLSGVAEEALAKAFKGKFTFEGWKALLPGTLTAGLLGWGVSYAAPKYASSVLFGGFLSVAKQAYDIYSAQASQYRLRGLGYATVEDFKNARQLGDYVTPQNVLAARPLGDYMLPEPRYGISGMDEVAGDELSY